MKLVIKKFLSCFVVCILFVLGNVEVFAYSDRLENDVVATAYHAITYQKLGEVSNLNFDSNTGEFSFTLNEKNYHFQLKPWESPSTREELPDVVEYYGETNDYMCSLSSNGINMSIHVLPKSGIGTDPASNHTDFLMIVVGGRKKMQDAFSELTDLKIVKQIKQHNLNLSSEPLAKTASTVTPRKSLHVLANGDSMSEGWATSTHAYSNMYKVHVYQYNVKYIWGGDGVSLFSRYYTQPSIVVWNTPARPPAGLQSVNVTAEIDVTEGKLEALAHNKFIVEDLPFYFPIYDSCDIA